MFFFGDFCNCSGPGEDIQESSFNGLLDLR